MGRLHNRLNHIVPSFPSQRLFSYLPKEKATPIDRQNKLHRFARSWDSTIRKKLKNLAGAKWPRQRWLAVFPVLSTRIRRESGPQKICWWVEHDLPPYDRYRCAAYFVEAELDEFQNIILTVRSGSKKYRVEEPINLSLEQNLSNAAQDLPVIIPRRMGPAFE